MASVENEYMGVWVVGMHGFVLSVVGNLSGFHFMLIVKGKEMEPQHLTFSLLLTPF